MGSNPIALSPPKGYKLALYRKHRRIMDPAPAEPEVGATANLLLVEDEPDDQALFSFAVQRSRVKLRIHRVANGQQALDYLEGVPPFNDRQRYPFPDLVVLDLAMPLMNGFELLSRLKAAPHLQHLPVIVLTGTCIPAWKDKALALGAAKVFEKCARIDDGAALVREMAGWLPPSPSQTPTGPSLRLPT